MKQHVWRNKQEGQTRSHADGKKKALRSQAQVNKQEDIQGHLPDSHVKKGEAGKHTLRLGPPSQGRDERQAAAEPGS